MTDLLSICLKEGREQNWLYGHPWIFSGAVKKRPKTAEPGQQAAVYTEKGTCVGIGYYHPDQSIALRMLTREKQPVDALWLEKRLSKCKAYRQQLLDHETTAYRLCFGESDGVPGLVIDVYDTCAVVEVNTRGIERLAPHLLSVLPKLGFNECLVRHQSASAKKEGVTLHVANARAQILAKERGFQIIVPCGTGQKTGWFCDQRDNREILQQWIARQKIETVLNLFSYTGGFALYALAGGARQVVNVDRDETALALFGEMAALNHFSPERFSSLCANAWDYLATSTDRFDFLILDPPAFAKESDKQKAALKGYRDLFKASLRLLKPGGSLAFFSCSHFITQQDLQWVLRQVMQETGRLFQTVFHLTQAADHPIPAWFPEGEYLKGFLLQEI